MHFTNDLMHDLRVAARALLRAPAFTVPAAAILALGIGLTVAIFSIVYASLVRPLPFAEPDRLIVINEARERSGSSELAVSAHEYVAWRTDTRSLSHMALVLPTTVALTGRGEATSVGGFRVSPGFFPLLGVQPLAGAAFAGEDDEATPQPVAVIGERLWRDRFGADSTVIGGDVVVDGNAYTIVAVMPALPEAIDAGVWLPMDVTIQARAVGRHNLQVIARLAPGATIEQARAELTASAERLERELPNDNTGHRVAVTRFRDAVTADARRPLLVLLGATAFVLLIACVNVANLMVARTVRRHRELAIRTALGATWPRIVRTLLAESALLSTVAGATGLLIASWLVDLLPRVSAVTIPLGDMARIDTTVLAVAVVLSVGTALLTAVLPSFRLLRSGLGRGSFDGLRVVNDRGGRRSRNTLVTAEVSLAMVLLIGAGLLLNSFLRLSRVDPGFETDQQLVTAVDLPGSRYATPELRRQFFDDVIARVGAIPGVRHVGATSHLPLGGADNWIAVSISGRPEPAAGQAPSVQVRVVTPEYFAALGIPVRAGRTFDSMDARATLPLIRWYVPPVPPPVVDVPQATPAVIINETAARQFWPGENPLGRTVRVLFSPEMTVVGIVGDIRHNALDTPTYPQFYLAHSQEPWASASIVVRTDGNPASLAEPVGDVVRAIDPALPLSVTTMNEVVGRSVGRPRFYATLVGVFALSALLLAVIGVYAVVNFTTVQRTQEIGVRLALGARDSDVLRTIIGQAARPVLAGVALGLGGAIVVSGQLERLLFDVTPTDPVTFMLMASLMTGVSLLACWIPARRAGRVDPLTAMRSDQG